MTPTGTWRMYRKPKIGGLVIGAVDPDGSFTGTVFGHRMSGLWNAASNYIVFNELLPGGGGKSKSAKGTVAIVQYTGYLAQHPTSLLIMAGEFITCGSALPGRGTWKAARRP